MHYMTCYQRGTVRVVAYVSSETFRDKALPANFITPARHWYLNTVRRPQPVPATHERGPGPEGTYHA